MNQDLAAQFQGMQSQAQSVQPAQQAAPAGPPGLAPSPPVDGGLVPMPGGEKLDATVAGQAEELLGQFPSLKIVSGHRDASRNKREGGVDRSWHLKGKAADFKGPLQDMYKAAAHAQSSGAVESLVHNGGNGMILHVAWAGEDGGPPGFG